MRFCVHVREHSPVRREDIARRGKGSVLYYMPETNNPKSLIRLLYTNGRFGIMRYEAIISLAVQTIFVTFVANRH